MSITTCRATRARLAVIALAMVTVAACTTNPVLAEEPVLPEEPVAHVDPAIVRAEVPDQVHVDPSDGLASVFFPGTDPLDLATARIENPGVDPVVVTRAPLSPADAQVAVAARAQVITLGTAQIAVDAGVIDQLHATRERPVVVMGDDVTAQAVATVRASDPLPNGTYRVFGARTHYVALYGHPGTPALGVLGEQGPRASVKRVKKMARVYQRLGPRATVVPMFEIIATIASAEPGRGSNYSRHTPVAALRPLVDAAARNGVMVLLDLQPGREDFLTQAKRYRSLLREPHVGLALDPEWRLKKNQVHLRQIGSVRIREVNRTAAWLARFVRRHDLPQKMFVLHQFKSTMIQDRERLDTSHRELATVIHVDGQGPTGSKFDTWHHLRRDAPRVHWGWKNFYDEDPDMLSPRETWRRVKPRPDLITYQ